MNALGAGRDTAGVARAPNSLILAAGYAVLFVIACIPIFSVSVLPLGDTLNHAARIYVLNNLAADPELQRHYAVHWDLFSFQSTDLLLPPLTQWLGLDNGMQVFVAASFALLIAGTAAVHRVLFGRVGFWPAAAFLFLFNFPLMSGQISYLFSTGLGLLLFAAWITTERWSAAIRVPIFAAASFGLMLCHFFAFAAYALLVMCFALTRARRAWAWRDKLWHLVEAGLPFVVPTICFLWSFGQTISGTTSYGKLLDKSIAVLVGTLTYGRWPDIVLTVSIIAAIWWLNRRRRIVLAPGMQLPVVVLLLTAIAMPNLLQGVFAADLRLPILLYFLLVAASEIRLEGRGQAIAFSAGVVALLVLRVGVLTMQWSQFNADYREFRAADQLLERGSRVAVIPAGDDRRPKPQPQSPYWFISCFAVIDRQVFTAQIYTAATPLRLSPETSRIYSDTPARDRKVRWNPIGSAFAGVDPATVLEAEEVGQRISRDDIYTSRIDWSDWPEEFDYLIDLHLGRPRNPVPALLTEVVRGSYFTIYRIHPPRQ